MIANSALSEANGSSLISRNVDMDPCSFISYCFRFNGGWSLSQPPLGEKQLFTPKLNLESPILILHVYRWLEEVGAHRENPRKHLEASVLTTAPRASH